MLKARSVRLCYSHAGASRQLSIGSEFSVGSGGADTSWMQAIYPIMVSIFCQWSVSCYASSSHHRSLFDSVPLGFHVLLVCFHKSRKAQRLLNFFSSSLSTKWQGAMVHAALAFFILDQDLLFDALLYCPEVMEYMSARPELLQLKYAENMWLKSVQTHRQT